MTEKKKAKKVPKPKPPKEYSAEDVASMALKAMNLILDAPIGRRLSKADGEKVKKAFIKQHQHEKAVAQVNGWSMAGKKEEDIANHLAILAETHVRMVKISNDNARIEKEAAKRREAAEKAREKADVDKNK